MHRSHLEYAHSTEQRFIPFRPAHSARSHCRHPPSALGVVQQRERGRFNGNLIVADCSRIEYVRLVSAKWILKKSRTQNAFARCTWTHSDALSNPERQSLTPVHTISVVFSHSLIPSIFNVRTREWNDTFDSFLSNNVSPQNIRLHALAILVQHICSNKYEFYRAPLILSLRLSPPLPPIPLCASPFLICETTVRSFHGVTTEE